MDPHATPNLVILAGQSNMVGYKTSLKDIAPKWRTPIANATIWQDDGFVPLQIGAGYQRKGYGPEISFAHSYRAATDRPLALVKLAKNGSYLATDWSPAIRDGLFERLVDATRRAMMDRTVHLTALLWMQGEADSITKPHAQAYRENLQRFMTAFRLAIGAPTLPVIAGVVNPPAKACPHGQRVREALTQNNLENLRTIDCDDLPKRRDDLHYTPRGISILGRRFASALSARHSQNALQTRWLWKSDQYHVWQEGPDLSHPDQMISMPFATKASGLNEPGFGQSHFSKHRINTTYIRANVSNWFQDNEVFDVADMIRDRLPKSSKPVIYGASMGAYGALLLSGRLDARKVIAVAPQYSIDRAQVPWETRWKRAAKKIGGFRHRLEDAVSRDAQKFVLYDPMSADRAQVEMFAKDESWNFVGLPFTSHQVLQSLLETGALPILLKDLFDGGPDITALVQKLRGARRTSKIYWLSLAQSATQRRPTLARYALTQAQSCGAPARKIRHLLEALEEAQSASRKV